ncbi:hypothetical protein NE578_10355, partial [Schaalia odontolytica]|nr:hypothetical protein [Schaalia odontolytica]
IKELEQSKDQNSLVWVNDIAYKDRTVNLMEATMKTEDGKSKEYVFITDIKITKKNVERLIAAGRSRWKIENQGFNEQK